MSRRAIEKKDTTFNPVTKTIVINRVVHRERLLLITNITQNKIIYNFSDPSIGLESYSLSADQAQPKTTLVLDYNTASMLATDNLQIMVDELYETFMPEPTMMDAVGKLRISAPESIIDTDFEYGVQGSKWETLTLQNNYPTFFARNTGGNSLDIISMTGNGASPRSTITVITSVAHGLNTGDVANAQETLNPLTEGTFLITALGPNEFTYTCKGIVLGSVLDGVLTTVYGGGIYDNAHIPGGNIGELNTFFASSDGAANSTVTITTPRTHGLFPGTPILFSGIAGNPLNGSFLVTSVPTTTTMNFQLGSFASAGTMDTTGLSFYCKPEGYVDHRPFDGGVVLSTGNNVCGTQTIRQTRKYFRYQSGKSIQFSTGTKFTPSFDITAITSSSVFSGANTVTVTLLQDHNLQPGATVKLEGLETVGSYNPYNGIFEVISVLNSNTFMINIVFQSPLSPIDQSPGGVNAFVTAYAWKGSATRAGLYDDQNGFYFEFDGQKLYACRRFSNKELFGKVQTTKFSSEIIGTGTSFRKQLTVGDMVVIRGQSYRVNQINNDFNMIVSPAYRGPSTLTARILKTQIEKVPQSDWNVDKMNGTGPSGYTLDVSKMQMTYIDYSWYGAGSIRFGMRTVDGGIAWCHKIVNNNVNTSAYMRSGNLPARYEAINEPLNCARLISGGTAISGATLFPQDTVIYVDDVKNWAPNGYLRIADASNVEICKYNSIGAYNPSIKATAVNIERRSSQPLFYGGVQYALTGTSQSVNFAPDSTIPGGLGTSQVSVQTISQTCAPVLSHWGSSVIMDGGFNDDKSFIFTAGMQRYINVGGSGTISATIVNRAITATTATLGTSGVHSLVIGSPVTVTGVNNLANAIYKQKSATVATITTSTVHKFVIGDVVTIAGIDTVFNGTYTVASVPSTSTFTFAKTGTVVPFTAVTPTTNSISASSKFNGTFPILSTTTSSFSFYLNQPDEAASSVNPNGAAVQSFSTTATPRPLVSIRLAPSVDNGIGRNFAIRELANRMQMKLDSIGILSQGQFLIEGILNPASINGVAIPTAWEEVRVGSGSLSQVIYHDGSGTAGTPISSPTNTIQGGDRIFAFYTENSGGTNYSVTSYDAKKVRDLSNCILNGNGSQTNPSYPNGPDILTIIATNLGSAAAAVTARVSWTEAQA